MSVMNKPTPGRAVMSVRPASQQNNFARVSVPDASKTAKPAKAEEKDSILDKMQLGSGKFVRRILEKHKGGYIAGKILRAVDGVDDYNRQMSAKQFKRAKKAGPKTRAERESPLYATWGYLTASGTELLKIGANVTELVGTYPGTAKIVLLALAPVTEGATIPLAGYLGSIERVADVVSSGLGVAATETQEAQLNYRAVMSQDIRDRKERNTEIGYIQKDYRKNNLDKIWNPISFFFKFFKFLNIGKQAETVERAAGWVGRAEQWKNAATDLLARAAGTKWTARFAIARKWVSQVSKAVEYAKKLGKTAKQVWEVLKSTGILLWETAKLAWVYTKYTAGKIADGAKWAGKKIVAGGKGVVRGSIAAAKWTKKKAVQGAEAVGNAAKWAGHKLVAGGKALAHGTVAGAKWAGHKVAEATHAASSFLHHVGSTVGGAILGAGVGAIGGAAGGTAAGALLTHDAMGSLLDPTYMASGIGLGAAVGGIGGLLYGAWLGAKSGWEGPKSDPNDGDLTGPFLPGDDCPAKATQAQVFHAKYSMGKRYNAIGMGAVVFVNGQMTDLLGHHRAAQGLANSSGRPVVGVYNATDPQTGVAGDTLQSALDKLRLNKRKNPATKRLVEIIKRHGDAKAMKKGDAASGALKMVGHSQGTIIIEEARRIALEEEGVDIRNQDITTFGNAVLTQHQLGTYRHFSYEGDLVSRLVGATPLFGAKEGEGRSSFSLAGLAAWLQPGSDVIGKRGFTYLDEVPAPPGPPTNKNHDFNVGPVLQTGQSGPAPDLTQGLFIIRERYKRGMWNMGQHAVYQEADHQKDLPDYIRATQNMVRLGWNAHDRAMGLTGNGRDAAADSNAAVRKLLQRMGAHGSGSGATDFALSSQLDPALLRATLTQEGGPGSSVSGQDVGFGSHFGTARVHRSPAAARAANALNAEAFTIGSDVFFGANRYDPHTPQGRGLLAHELTHVAQQTGGGLPLAAQGFSASGGDAMEQQAQAVGRMVSGGLPFLPAEPRIGAYNVSYDVQGYHLPAEDQRRLGQIAKTALDEAKARLVTMGMPSGVVDSVDAHVDIDLEAMTDAEAVDIWANALVQAVRASVPQSANSNFATALSGTGLQRSAADGATLSPDEVMSNAVHDLPALIAGGVVAAALLPALPLISAVVGGLAVGRYLNRRVDDAGGLMNFAQTVFMQRSQTVPSPDLMQHNFGLQRKPTENNKPNYDPITIPQYKPGDPAQAAQCVDESSVLARKQVIKGATLYRTGTRGKSGAAEAQYWSLESPLTPGYAKRYGIPEENFIDFNFYETATIKPGRGFITRPAPGVGANEGGAIEVVVDSGSVNLTGWHALTLNEEYRRRVLANSCIASENPVRVISDVVSVFESRNDPSGINTYDKGIISYGKHQFTLAAGSLANLLAKYVSTSKDTTAEKLKSYLSRVQAKDKTLSPKYAKTKEEKEQAEDFLTLLGRAGSDPVMVALQDAHFKETYYDKAAQYATNNGVTSPLGLLVFSDLMHNSGEKALKEWDLPPVAAEFKGKPHLEKEFLLAFVVKRQSRLLSRAEKLETISAVAATNEAKAIDKKIATLVEQSKTKTDKAKQEIEEQIVEARRLAEKKRETSKTLIAEAKILRNVANGRVEQLKKLVEAGDMELTGGKNGALTINGTEVEGRYTGTEATEKR